MYRLYKKAKGRGTNTGGMTNTGLPSLVEKYDFHTSSRELVGRSSSGTLSGVVGASILPPIWPGLTVRSGEGQKCLGEIPLGAIRQVANFAGLAEGQNVAGLKGEIFPAPENVFPSRNP